MPDTAVVRSTSYIVFELKSGRVEPGHLGTLNFYISAVDDLLRRPEHGDGSTIGEDLRPRWR